MNRNILVKKQILMIAIGLMVFFSFAITGCTSDGSDSQEYGEITPVEKDCYEFKVEEDFSYSNTLGPFWCDYLEEEYYCEIDISVPKISSETPGAEKINDRIAEFTSFERTLYDGIRKGDYSSIEGPSIANVGCRYGQYNCGDSTAFFVEHVSMAWCTGASPVRMSVYYDNARGVEIEYDEYAQMNGYTIDEVLDEFYQSEYAQYGVSVSESDIGESLHFYFNENGELEFEFYVMF